MFVCGHQILRGPSPMSYSCSAIPKKPYLTERAHFGCFLQHLKVQMLEKQINFANHFAAFTKWFANYFNMGADSSGDSARRRTTQDVLNYEDFN